MDFTAISQEDHSHSVNSKKPNDGNHNTPGRVPLTNRSVTFSPAGSDGAQLPHLAVGAIPQIGPIWYRIHIRKRYHGKESLIPKHHALSALRENHVVSHLSENQPKVPIQNVQNWSGQARENLCTACWEICGRHWLPPFVLHHTGAHPGEVIGTEEKTRLGLNDSASGNGL